MSDKLTDPHPWIKLMLEAQSENSGMPSSIVGQLINETAGQYIITNVYEQKFDDDGYDFEYIMTKDMHAVNKTYVWDCIVLAEKPDFTLMVDGKNFTEFDEGGLG